MSTKSVADKLLIKPGATIWTSDEMRLGLLGPLPDGVRPVGGLAEAAIAVLFADDAGSLGTLLARLEPDLSAPGVLWVAYPKANRTDLNRDTLWPMLVGYGLRPISQVAMDEVWSALRFRPLRLGEEGFGSGRGPT